MFAGGLLDHLAYAALAWQSIPRQILRVKQRAETLHLVGTKDANSGLRLCFPYQESGC